MTTLRATLDQALALHQAGRLPQAEALYRQILQTWPGQPDALNLLGVLANQVGRFDAAVDLIGQAVAKAPNESAYHGNFATALDNVGRVADAIHHYREAIRLQPGSVNYRVLLSDCLQQQGNLDEALAVGLDAIRLDPNSIQAYCVLGDLAALGGYALTEADIGHMHELLAQGRQTDAEASLLNFTLAAHWERAGKYDQAFACYRRANDLKLQVYHQDGQTFFPERHRAGIEKLMAVFTPELLARTRTFGVESETPIFVVGLVRSGTTLVEQILASHPQVHGAGERRDLDELANTLHTNLPTADLYPACLDRLDPGMARSLAYRYLQRLARDAGTASRIVDKMPHNYLHLGLIAMLFPRARIVHCRRDPMDVCASAYFQNFRLMTHASRLEDLASYHRDYTRLMEHWQRVLPMPIHEVIYEEMVAGTEATSRKLIAACGLDWDEHCLTFYRTKRVVQTASKLQVRQPIFRKSVGRWKLFRTHLEPLRVALGLPGPGYASDHGPAVGAAENGSPEDFALTNMER